MKTAKKLLALLLSLIMAMTCATVAFAAEAKETESNATPSSADEIVVGSKISAKLETPTDVDWFKFTSDSFGLAKVSLSHTAITGADSNVSFFKVEVIGADGVYIEAFKSAGNQASTYVEFSVIPGDYFIKVVMDRQHIDNLTYDVAVSLDKAANVEKEENDTLGDATLMSKTATKADPKVTYFGTIDKGSEASGDVDYYKFTVAQKTIIYPSIYNTSTNTGKYSITVLDTVTGEGGVAVERPLGTLNIASNEVQVDGGAIGVNAGTYYVKIAGVDGSVGGYQFRIYTSPSTDSEMEYNNTAAKANDIYIGGQFTGCLFDSTDVDVYTFATKGNNAGYKITLKAYSTPKVTNGQWSLVVKNASDGQVCKKDILVTETGELSTEPLPAGEYFIYVTKGNVFSSDVYSIKLEALKAEGNSEPDKDDKTIIDKLADFADRVKALPWGEFVEPIVELVMKIGTGDLFTALSHFLESVIAFMTESFLGATG